MSELILHLPPAFETNVFLNDEGYVVISQLGERGTQESVALNLDRALQVSMALREFCERHRGVVSAFESEKD